MSITAEQVRAWIKAAPVGTPVEFVSVGNAEWKRGEVAEMGQGRGIRWGRGGWAGEYTVDAIRLPAWAVGPFRVTRYIDDDHWEYEVVGSDHMAVFASCCPIKCGKALASLEALAGEGVRT